MLDFIGWVGAFMFAICAIPQAYMSYQEKHSNGLSHMFLWTWLLGELCMIIYVYPKEDYPLLVNYCFNLSLLLVIMYYRYFGSNANS